MSCTRTGLTSFIISLIFILPAHALQTATVQIDIVTATTVINKKNSAMENDEISNWLRQISKTSRKPSYNKVSSNTNRHPKAKKASDLNKGGKKVGKPVSKPVGKPAGGTTYKKGKKSSARGCWFVARNANGSIIADGKASSKNVGQACQRARRRCNRELNRKRRKNPGTGARGGGCVRVQQAVN